MLNIEKHNPYKTAIQRDYLSRPMQELVRRNLLKGDILEYGCGRAVDSLWLWKDYNIGTWCYDKYNKEYTNEFLLNEHYDTITCLYVFNVIQSLKEHCEVLEILKKIGDNIYIAVRSDEKAINYNTWKYDKDGLGWITPKNTYQRFYTKENGLVEKLFGNVEYIINDSNMKLFKLSDK